MTDTWFDIYYDSDTHAVFMECNKEQLPKAEYIVSHMESKGIQFYCYDFNDGNMFFIHECSREASKPILRSLHWYASYFDRNRS